MELPTREAHAELLLHIAIHKETKPTTVPEENKKTIILYPQNFVLEVPDFIKPHQAHRVVIRKLPKQKIKTCRESRQCVACLADTQETLLRLASVCEKPPECLNAKTAQLMTLSGFFILLF